MKWRGTGLAMPVFSMRSQSSIGCGDFSDIKKMVDFVAAAGMCVLQVCSNFRMLFRLLERYDNSSCSSYVDCRLEYTYWGLFFLHGQGPHNLHVTQLLHPILAYFLLVRWRQLFKQKE
jgi:hypothetical protein